LFHSTAAFKAWAKWVYCSGITKGATPLSWHDKEIRQGEAGLFVPSGINRNAWTDKSASPMRGQSTYQGTWDFFFLAPPERKAL
jgi:hypothetical protein